MNWSNLKQLLQLIRKNSHNLINYSAQLSYAIILALLPILMLYYMMTSTFFSGSGSTLLRAFEVVFPPGILDYSQEQIPLLEQARATSIDYMFTHPVTTFVSLFAIIFFIAYAIIRVVRTIMIILTRVSQFRETRPILVIWLDALYYTIVLASMIFLAVYFYIMTSDAGEILHTYLRTKDLPFLAFLFDVVSIAYLLAILVGLMTWCYASLSSVRLRIYQALPGAIVFVTTWILVTNLLRVLQIQGLWPVSRTDLTRSINLLFYAFLFSYFFILGEILNIQIIRLRRSKNYSNQIVSKRADKKYETRSIRSDTMQIGKIDQTLILPSRHPKLTSKDRYKKLSSQITDSLVETNFTGICTQLAFYLMCALVPLLIYLLEFVSRVNESFQSVLYQILADILPSLSYEYIVREISELMLYADRTHYFMAVFALLFTCISIHSLLSGINQTYGFSRYRLKRELWIKSLTFTILMTVACEFLLQIYRISDSIRQWINSVFVFGLPDAWSASLYVFFFTEIALFLFLSAIYYTATEQNLSYREILPGSAFATIALSIIMRIYMGILDQSQTYLMIYGSQSGLFMLLVTMFFISCVLNIGVKVNVFFSPKR